MHIRLPRSAPAVLLAAGMLTLAFTGGAVAAGLVTSADIKDGTVASVDVKDGTVRKRDLADTTITDLRGQVGPQGPQGQQGDQGPQGLQGPEGPPGLSAVYRTSPSDVTLPGNATSVTVGSLDLPAGAYVVTATFQLTNTFSVAQPVLCNISVGTDTGGPYALILESNFTGNFTNIPVTLTRAGELATAGTATVSCYDNTGNPDVHVDVRRIQLWAIQAGSLVTQ